MVGLCCQWLPLPLLVAEVRFNVSSVSLVIDIVTWVALSAPTLLADVIVAACAIPGR